MEKIYIEANKDGKYIIEMYGQKYEIVIKDSKAGVKDEKADIKAK